MSSFGRKVNIRTLWIRKYFSLNGSDTSSISLVLCEERKYVVCPTLGADLTRHLGVFRLLSLYLRALILWFPPV